jgi:hypothetical protein
MTQNMKLEDSIALAHRLHNSAVGGMSKAISEVKDLGVKKALFYVLVGARMPSVLVEMFFITNPNEGRSMGQESTQEAMVEALMQGIQKYAPIQPDRTNSLRSHGRSRHLISLAQRHQGRTRLKESGQKLPRPRSSATVRKTSARRQRARSGRRLFPP